MSRALVTGATGLLGSYIVERLLRDGTEVRALVRAGSGSDWLTRQGVELVQGDLADPAALRRACETCDVVFHAAAEVGSHDDHERFRGVNVAGTERLLEAAAATGARVLHVSSTAVFGAARYREVPTDESAPWPELPPHDAYGLSKQASELRVLEAHRSGRVWATVVRPPVMYGVRDRQFAPRIGPVFERGVFPLVGGGHTVLTLVWAGSVADGAVRAARHEGAGGRVYHLTNDRDVTVADLVRHAERGLGRRIRRPVVPLVLAGPAFRLLAGALRAAGRPDLARHTAGTRAMLTRDNPFSSRRAREELGWNPDFDAGARLEEAFQWWRERR